jgi:hypothetical protein
MPPERLRRGALFGAEMRRPAVDADRPKGRLGVFFEGKHVADNPEEAVELAARLARLQPSGLTSCSTTDVEMRPSATQIPRMKNATIQGA